MLKQKESHNPAMYVLDPKLKISITLRDYETLSLKLYDYLSQFNCKKLIIKTIAGDMPDRISSLKKALEKRGYEVDIKPASELKGIQSFALDSIVHPIHILKKTLTNKENKANNISVSLMDHGDTDVILKGMPSILTSCGIPKPSYFGYLGMLLLRGSLICWGKYYSIVRIDGEHPSYIIIVFNYNDSICSLCTRNITIHETHDIINKFNDELDINITLNNLTGNYVITRYSMDSHNNIFDYMAKLNFPIRLNSAHRSAAAYYTVPKVEIVSENIIQELNLNISLKGVGIQFVKIELLTRAEEHNE